MKRLGEHRLLVRFAGRAGQALFLRVLWAAITFAGAALLARWFQPKEYGQYAAVTSLITFLSVVCALGAPNALIRLLAEYGGDHPTEKQAALAHGVLRATQLGALGASLLAAAGLVGVGLALHAFVGSSNALIYVAGAAMLPAFTLTDVQTAAGRTYGQVFAALAPKDILWRLLLIPLGWAVTVMLAPRLQLTVFLLLAAAALTLFSFAQGWTLRRAAPAVVWRAKPDYRLRDLVRISTSTWVTQVASAVFRSLDVVIAGMFLPPREVGFYFAASRAAALISFVLTSTNLIIAPEIAKLHHSGEHEHLIRTLKLASLIVFLPSLGAFGLCVAFPDQVLSLFGHGFREARTELIILSVGQLINASTGCVGIVLMMTGQERKNAEVLVTSSILTVVAMLLLTRLYGAVGTATATTLGFALWNIRLWLVARQRTAYDPSVLGLFTRSRAQV